MSGQDIESDIIDSLILAAWRHGKLCGNPHNYA